MREIWMLASSWLFPLNRFNPSFCMALKISRHLTYEFKITVATRLVNDTKKKHNIKLRIDKINPQAILPIATKRDQRKMLPLHGTPTQLQNSALPWHNTTPQNPLKIASHGTTTHFAIKRPTKQTTPKISLIYKVLKKTVFSLYIVL